MTEVRPLAQRYVGQRLPRKEDKRLLTGRGTFTDDVRVPGVLHVAFVRSHVARGKILSISTEAARELPGVRAVFTSDDLDRFDLEMVSFYNISPPPGPKVYPLARGRVAHVGEAVAMVIAESRYIAEDGAGLIEIEIEAEDPVVTIDQARNRPKIHPDLDSNLAGEMASEADPELDEILSNAPNLVSATFVHQRVSQSPMEGRACVAIPYGEGRVTLHFSCQSPQMASRTLGMVFRKHDIAFRVIAQDVGGSFGLKTQPWREEISTICAALILGRPVKWTEDRLENLISANNAREQQASISLALDEEGTFLGSRMEYHNNNGAYPHMPEPMVMVPLFTWSCYKMPRFEYSAQGWYTNTLGWGGYRGPWAMESMIREVLIDTAARQLGIDAIELRRRNLITQADQPMKNCVGIELEDITPAECLEELLTRVDVEAFREEQRQARKEGRYLGLGIATYIEPTGGSTFHVLATDVAQVRIEPSGKVNAVLSTHSQGHGTETTMAQVIADELGVSVEDVSIHESDSSAGGFGAGAAGSRQAIAGGGASIRASQLLADKVRKVAAYLLNANPGDIELRDGMVHVRGAEAMSRPLGEIASVTYAEAGRLPPEFEAGLEVVYRYRPPPQTQSSAAHACIVEVDTTTGFVEIKRWVVSEDCGVLINPGIVEGQVTGGLAQAIGSVLLEEIVYDRQGNPTAATFKDYLLPTIHDIPEFEFTHICTPSKGLGGFRGVGEGGAIIGVPTLMNAVADALSPFGIECHELPLSPSRILESIEGASAG